MRSGDGGAMTGQEELYDLLGIDTGELGCMMGESYARAVVSFQKTRFNLRRRPPTPVETQTLREMFEQKGNKPVDEEIFSKINAPVERGVCVDIELFVQHALELQAAVVDAEAQLKDAKQQWVDVEKALEIARLRWVEVGDALEKARGELRHHLEAVRGLNVTMPLPEGWAR